LFPGAAIETLEPSEYESENYQLLFELLCSRRIDDAIELAHSLDQYRLAMILSQLQNDDTIAEIMLEQLSLWESGGAQEENMDAKLLDIYRLTGTLYPLTSDHLPSLTRSPNLSCQPASGGTYLRISIGGTPSESSFGIAAAPSVGSLKLSSYTSPLRCLILPPLSWSMKRLRGSWGRETRTS
jgi:hypothetical protein